MPYLCFNTTVFQQVSSTYKPPFFNTVQIPTGWSPAVCLFIVDGVAVGTHAWVEQGLSN